MAANANANAIDRQLANSLKKLLLCSLTIVGVPVFALFIAKKSIFENIFHYSSEDSYLYAAIAAIVLVHLLLAAFVYTAWTESALPASPPHED